MLAVIGTVVAVAGPFGTFDLAALPLRLAFWGSLLTVAFVLARTIRIALDRWMPEGPRWPRDLLVIALFSGLFTPLVWLWFAWLKGGAGPAVLPLWLRVALVTAGVVALRRALGMEETHPAPRREAAPAPPPAPRLMRRLPQDTRAAVLSLSADDHFVVVRTAAGCARLRLRLADAVAEMEPEPGLYVHRSHWVARAALAGLRREGGRLFVRLSDGTELPVSRGQRERVLALGLPGA